VLAHCDCQTIRGQIGGFALMRKLLAEYFSSAIHGVYDL
jgi:hypothetical protein